MQPEEVAMLVESQRKYVATHVTKDLKFRIEMLKKIKASIIANEKNIISALEKDLRKSEFEAYSTEIGIVLEEIDFHLKHLKKWVKPVKVRTPLMNFPSKSYVLGEPFGVVLILAPWNYPFQLLMAPLIGAISAGNCVVLKPSEISGATAEVIEHIIKSTFSENYIAVINGGKEINQAILKEKYDYIFFTGGPVFGRIVMESASKHLTPITLELGGKSPAIVEDDADIKISAKRIVWGKFINAGQTCVAPDYLLVNSKIKGKLLDYIQYYINGFLEECAHCSPDYGRIINHIQFDRLVGLMENQKIFTGGEYKREDLFISPTILIDVDENSPVMQEEIFGPILPVIEYQKLDDAIDFINRRAKPLALYFFSGSRHKQDYLLRKTSFGGGCINDTLLHLTNPYLPFGGVGSSGMGGYHGKKSYDTFSHSKSILRSVTWYDLPVRYAPYKNKIRLVRKVMG